MRNKWIILSLVLTISLFVLTLAHNPIQEQKNNPAITKNIEVATPLPTQIRQIGFFEVNKKIVETGSASESNDSQWWLNSGAYLYINNGTAKTVWGDLNKSDYFYTAYLKNNPKETDGGIHPQNIFRLVTKNKYKNFTQQVYFKMNKYIQSSAKERQASNGVLLFNRYQNGQTLYYAGLRVDGQAVIKKKYNGTYYTMISKKVINGKYDSISNPNILFTNKWVGIKTEVINLDSQEVEIKLYIDFGDEKGWVFFLDTIDKNNRFDSTPIINTSGYGGIRTDFMDVEFKNYDINENQ